MSKRTVVVVGSTPFATSVASLFAEEGLGVQLVLDEAPEDEPPWDLGASRADAGQRALLERAWGPLVEVADDRAVSLGGALRALPMGRRALVQGLPDPRAALLDLARVRGRRRLGTVLALGKEIRSYRDWVVYELGEGLYEQLYRPWASKRFATDPAQLSAAVAIRAHALPPRGPWLTPARPWSEVVHSQRARVQAVHLGLTGVEVVDGRPVVLTEGLRLRADLALFQRSPRLASAWIEPTPGPRVEWDLQRLGAAHAVQVTLPARCEALPWVTHVLDPQRPFWRLSRPGRLASGARWQGQITAHLSLAETDPLWQADDATLADAVRQGLIGLADPRRGEAVVQRRPHAVPWSGQTSSLALARRLEALDAAGLLLVGPEGVHQLLDPAQALEYALALGDSPGQRSAHRERLERPPRLPREVSPRMFSTA